MVRIKSAFSGYSVDDIDKAKEFYTTTLGLEVTDGGMGIELMLPNNNHVFIYAKPNHEPASFTTLNLVVDDINQSVDDLVTSGVEFIRYDGFGQDERGVMRGKDKNMGPNIAWFNDPAGNVLALVEN